MVLVEYFQELLKQSYERLDKILRLKYQIDQIEILAKPSSMPLNKWKHMSRESKWKKMLNDSVSEDFILGNLFVNIREKFEDTSKFLKQLVLLYIKLETTLHKYVQGRYIISEQRYNEIFTNDLIPLLSLIHISEPTRPY